MTPEARRFIRSLLLQAVLAVAVLTFKGFAGWGDWVPHAYVPAWVGDLLAAAWWLGLAWNVTTGLELFLWRRLFGHAGGGVPRQRKLLTDMAGILVYLAAAAMIMVHVFDQPPTALFATSGVVAVVVGLALQNTLADLFAGLALNIERPFKAGDWISVDGNLQGLVLVTNWRSTHIRTRTADELILPNSVVAKARLVNHMHPAKAHLANVEVPLVYGFDEDEVEAALRRAAQGVAGVLADPAPIILLHELGPERAVWRIYFFLDEFARLVVLRGLVAKAAYTELRAAGLARFQPRTDIWVHKDEAFSIGLKRYHEQDHQA